MEVSQAFDVAENIIAGVACEGGLTIPRRGRIRRNVGLNRRRRCRGLSRYHRQTRNINQSVLAGQNERSARRLLLRKTADVMIERIVQGDPPTDLDGQASGLEEISVARAILCADAGGAA